jgi:5'-methylthioadenosine phosphorylase
MSGKGSSEARADLALVGGTGLGRLEGLTDIEDLALDTPFGPPSAPLRLGTWHGRRIAFLARHGAGHRLLPHEVPYRANVHALKQLGVRKVLATGAVGSLVEELPPRALVVPDQVIDRTTRRADTFFGDGLVAHVPLGEPFAPALRQVLLQAVALAGEVAQDGGTYIGMEGPAFSTRAESRLYRQWGGTVIGMTASTEARLMREAEIAYASLCLVTDYDSWRPEDAPVDTATILRVLADNAARATAVLAAALDLVPEGALPENDVLPTSLLTPVERIPAEVRERLAPILARLLT